MYFLKRIYIFFVFSENDRFLTNLRKNLYVLRGQKLILFYFYFYVIRSSSHFRIVEKILRTVLLFNPWSYIVRNVAVETTTKLGPHIKRVVYVL